MPRQTAGSTSTKPSAGKRAKKVPANIEDEIRLRAYEYFTLRSVAQSSGDDMSDWLKAEADIKQRHGLG